jgi:hypothetical protein
MGDDATTTKQFRRPWSVDELAMLQEHQLDSDQDMALLLSRAREEIRVMRRIMQLPTGKVLGGIEPDRKTNVTRLAE